MTSEHTAIQVGDKKLKTSDYFMINGVSSDTLENILVNTPNIMPKAKQKGVTVDVGTDQSRTYLEDAYENITYQVVFFAIDRPANDTELREFLADAKTLQISRYEGVYYKVQSLAMADIDISCNNRKIKYTLEFELSPFQYSALNDPIQVSSGDNIVNFGTRYSKPRLEITGAGETNFTFNGDMFKLLFPDSGMTVVVDSETERVWKKDTNEQLWNFSGGLFPVLSPGNNIISFDKPSQMTIWKNERWY